LFYGGEGYPTSFGLWPALYLHEGIWCSMGASESIRPAKRPATALKSSYDWLRSLNDNKDLLRHYFLQLISPTRGHKPELQNRSTLLPAFTCISICCTSTYAYLSEHKHTCCLHKRFLCFDISVEDSNTATHNLCPPLADIIWTMTILWRMRNCSVLCCVWQLCTSTHTTHMISS